MIKKSQWYGSMTVESAIILPVFIIIVFTMIMLTKLVYIHAIIQNALVQTVKEISTYSYIVKEVLHLNDIHNTVTQVLEGNIENTNFNKNLEQFGKAIDGNIDAIQSIGQTILSDPIGYGTDVLGGGLSATALNVYQSLLGEGTGMIADQIFPIYIGKSKEELDYLMTLLGVEGGLSGIRIKGNLFSGSNGTSIDLIAAYKVALDPPLSYFLNGKTMIQRASCIPWMGESK